MDEEGKFESENCILMMQRAGVTKDSVLKAVNDLSNDAFLCTGLGMEDGPSMKASFSTLALAQLESAAADDDVARLIPKVLMVVL